MLSTAAKVRIARWLSTIVLGGRSLLGLSSKVTVHRRGIKWQLNLKEGIDLAIYVLGGFEVRTLKRYEALIKEGDVVLDIGANIGAHTLPLASLVGSSGKVYSFEPTAYAYSKQLVNIGLNPGLAARIAANQIMLTDSDSSALPEAIYSSWPLESAEDLHIEHRGRLMGTEGAKVSTLDAFLEGNAIKRVDFIKIDVDGNEASLLRGAKASLVKFRPRIMIELAPYVHGDNPYEFDELVAGITALGYHFDDMATGKRLPSDPSKLKAFIPALGGLNVLATSSY